LSATVLYIVGNGFDLHHGLATSFSNFKEFLTRSNANLQSTVEEYLCDLSGNWANLEEALAYFDTDQLIDHASNFLVSYGAYDWSDSYHHDYQYEINEIVQAVSSQLKTEFLSWIQTIQVPNEAARRLLKIEPSALFLNFNYTNTIQELYSTYQPQVLHIHGSAKGGEEIILGHGWSPTERPKLNEWNEVDDVDTRVMEGFALIEDYFEDTFKATDEIIKRNQSFFDGLLDVTDIYVWGHSLSNVDLPYFSKVAAITNANCPTWHVSYYSPSSIKDNATAMSSIGIEDSRLRHHQLVEFALNN
jgi:hypothetical protein